eukprot:15455211-Alexandrium_andersonii.AAC.1
MAKAVVAATAASKDRPFLPDRRDPCAISLVSVCCAYGHCESASSSRAQEPILDHTCTLGAVDSAGMSRVAEWP